MCGPGSFREHVAHAHNPFLLQRRKSRYAELDFEVSAGVSLSGQTGRVCQGLFSTWELGEGPRSEPGGQQQVGQRGGCGCPSWLRTRGPNPQKIMHTRKRHQDMFQDLNRKLQHAAEKEKEVPGADSSKVRRVGGLCASRHQLLLPASFPPSLTRFLVGLPLRCTKGRAGGA